MNKEERAKCFSALRERLGYENPYQFAAALHETGIFPDLDGAKKNVYRWEEKGSPLRDRTRAQLSKAIRKLGYYRESESGRSGHIDKLLRDLDRMENAIDWISSIDLKHIEEAPETLPIAGLASDAVGRKTVRYVTKAGESVIKLLPPDEGRVQVLESTDQCTLYECEGPWEYHVRRLDQNGYHGEMVMSFPVRQEKIRVLVAAGFELHERSSHPLDDSDTAKAFDRNRVHFWSDLG